MLGFPRYVDDIFEMKRPQFAGRYFDRDIDEEASPFMNHQTSQQFKQPRRVPVPVQHEPNFQHQWQQQRQYQPQQMPVPQPTGTAQGGPNVTTQPSNESRQRVRSPIQIPVRHVPIVQQMGEMFSPSEHSKTEIIVPVRNEQAPRRVHGPKEMEIEQEVDVIEKQTGPESPKLETPECPLVRKQTSLIVSDDHTTPIPMPYEHLHAGDAIMEHKEDGEENVQASTKINHEPLQKQTSLIVSEDHTTPIPMSYEHLHIGDTIMEYNEDGEDNAAASAERNHRPLRKQTSLIVSEDHTTPIPMPYEHLHTGDTIMEHKEDGEENADASTKRNHQPLLKQASLIVSEDHATPIPMPYEHLHADAGDTIIDYKEDGEENTEASAERNHWPLQKQISLIVSEDHTTMPEVVEESEQNEVDASQKEGKRMASPLSLEIKGQGRREKADASPTGIPVQIVKSSAPDEMVKDTSRTSTASVVLSPRSPRKFTGRPFSPEAREIPITVRGRTIPVQRSTQPEMPERSEPSLSESIVNSGMPQPGSIPAAESAQPKPAAPRPKEHWVDPRIVAALETIEKVGSEAEALGTQADALQATTKDRTYRLIEEQLTKLLLKLDSIDALGDDGVRSKRKSCIRQVQQTLDALELKLEAS